MVASLIKKIKLLDADDVFAYHTPRTVLIRDRKLGITRLMLFLTIFIYIVLYEIILEKGYLQKETPVGFFARLSVKNFVQTSNVSDLGYCCMDPGCSEFSFGSPRGRLPCVIWSDADSVNPSAEEFSAFITTRVTVTKFKGIPARCLLNEQTSNRPPECTGWVVDPQVGPNGVAVDKLSYYVTNVEDHSLLIRHAIYGPKNDQVLSSVEDMPKARMASKGEYVRNFCDTSNSGDMSLTCVDNPRGTERLGDIMSLRELMEWAGLPNATAPNGQTTHLDFTSQVSGSVGDTIRYDGGVFVIVVDYAGTSVARDTVKYTYHVKSLPQVEYKNVERRDFYYYENGEEMVRRELWNRHGIRLLVVYSGWMGKFHFVELLKTLVAGFALLAVASAVMEYVVLKLLPNSDIYSRYKKVFTIDFSTLKKGTREVKEDLTWGGRHLTDEVFVYGELDEEEQEISDAVRMMDVEYRGDQARQPARAGNASPSPNGGDLAALAAGAHHTADDHADMSSADEAKHAPPPRALPGRRVRDHDRDAPAPTASPPPLSTHPALRSQTYAAQPQASSRDLEMTPVVPGAHRSRRTSQRVVQ